jgi:hypothetical protein
VVQEWLLWQIDVRLNDWLPQTPDMNHILNMKSEVKKTMQKIWPYLLLKKTALLTLVPDAWDEDVYT